MTDKVKALSAKELREYKWHALLNPSSDKERLRRLLATIAADRKRLAELEALEKRAKEVLADALAAEPPFSLTANVARRILEGDSAAKGEQP